MALAAGSKYNDPERAAHRSSQVIGRIAAIDGEAIVVHQERCAKVRNRNVVCLKCAAACTSGCISYAHNELRVDPDLCVGCGTCATVCPTCCLEAHHPADSELLHTCENVLITAKDGKKQVVIACHLALSALEGLYRPEAVAEVVCAGRVEEALLCTLRACGVDRVSVLCGDCDRCAQKQGRVTADMVAATCNLLMETWGQDALVCVVDGPSEDILLPGIELSDAVSALTSYFHVDRACEPIRSKLASEASPAADPESDGSVLAGVCGSEAARTSTADCNPLPAETVSGIGEKKPRNSVDYLPDEPKIEQGLHFTGSRTSRHTKKNLRETLHVMQDGTLPHFVPDRRERLLDALSMLGAPAKQEVSCRLWGYAQIDPAKCLSCRMCATFCPTGAIAKFDEGDTFGIDHYPVDCVKCKSCFDICPGSAITIRDETAIDDLMSGRAHRFEMKPREVPLFGNAHQIQETMRSLMKCDVYER